MRVAEKFIDAFVNPQKGSGKGETLKKHVGQLIVKVGWAEEKDVSKCHVKDVGET